MPARHILIPLHDFSHGGTERIAMRLAHRWVAEGRRVTFIVGAREGPMEARVPPGAAIVALDPPRPRSTFSRVTLGKPMAEAARGLSPDVVLLVGNFHFVLARAMKRAMPGVPLIGKVSNPLVYNLFGHSALARAAAAGWTAEIDTLIAMAEANRREIQALLPERDVALIADPFLDDAVTIAGRQGKPGSPLNLLWVGRLEPQKAPLLALDVAEELRRRRTDFSLTILGSGSLDARMASEVAKRALGEIVTVQSHVSDPFPYYRAADLLLMTSRYEGVPAVIGEALSQGLPFVATPGSEWIADLAHQYPSVGTVTAGRSAGELADAITARARLPFPTTQTLEDAVGDHRLSRSADAYLALFDRLYDS